MLGIGCERTGFVLGEEDSAGEDAILDGLFDDGFDFPRHYWGCFAVSKGRDK